MTPQERRQKYVDLGYENRSEYLDGLAAERALDIETVRLAAHVLGPDQDFEALIVCLEKATEEDDE